MSTADALAEPVEVVSMIRGQPFRFDCRYGPKHPNRIAHAHDCTELVLILSGTAMHFTSFGVHRVTAGDVFVISGPCYHGYREVDNLTLMNIQFDAEQFLPADAGLRAMPGYKRLFAVDAPRARPRGFFCRMHLARADQAIAADLVWRLKNECTLQQPGYETLVRGLFHALVVGICRAYNAPAKDQPRHAAIARAVAFIEEQYAAHITIADLLRHTGLSHTHFDRLFRQEMGCYPTWYLMQVRVNHAAALLRDTDRRITDIALDVGFDDSNYFARVFKRILGMTPRAFRAAAQRRAASRPAASPSVTALPVTR